MSAENIKKISTEDKSQIGSLVSGVAVAYAITCIVFIAYSILLRYSRVSEENINLVVTITSLVSVIIAGFDAAKGARQSGWLWGIIAGVIYALILVCIGLFVNKGFVFDSSTLIMLILCMAGGGLGGVIGINIRK